MLVVCINNDGLQLLVLLQTARDVQTEGFLHLSVKVVVAHHELQSSSNTGGQCNWPIVGRKVWCIIGCGLGNEADDTLLPEGRYSVEPPAY